jgi:ApbE superfamily uncharacterized protein (UPF0280 family)
MNPNQNRPYRSLVTRHELETFRVAVKETDLMVRTERPLQEETLDLVLKHRMALERYIEEHPDFVDRLTPSPPDPLAPPIVKTMMEAGRKAGVGAMGAVAGAVAEYVGKDLLAYSREVIIENGGDIFITTTFPLTVAILAGRSSLSGKLGVHIDSPASPVGVCTSSGTVGHSLSLGRADAAVVISASAALADAAATAIGNAVLDKADIASAIRLGQCIDGVLGIVVILDDNMGVWGQAELVKLG